MNPNALHPDLTGRVAIVTGVSRGIGKALAIPTDVRDEEAVKSMDVNADLPDCLTVVLSDRQAQ